MQRIQSPQQPLPKPDTDVFYKGRKIPKEYMEVAQGMETQFTDYMLQEMDKTSLNDEDPSFSTKYYKSLLNHERAKIMAKTEGNMGLKDLVLDQILPRPQAMPHINQNSLNAYQAISKQGGENE